MAQPLRWDFDTPNVNNLLNPIMQGWDAGMRDKQQAVENRRAETQLGFQRQRLGMEQKRFDEDMAQKVRERAGNLALLTLQDTDENRRAQNWSKFIATHPNPNSLKPDYFDPQTGPMRVLADAGMAPQYLEWQLKQAAEKRAANAEGRAAAMHTPALTAAQNQNTQYENMSPADRIKAAPTLFTPEEISTRSTPYKLFIASGKYDKGENKALEAATAKTAVDLAENDIKAGYGAQEVIAGAKKLRELAQDPKINSAIGPAMGQPWVQTVVGKAVPFSHTLGLVNPELNQKLEQVKAGIVLSAQQKMRGLGSVSDSDAARVEKAVGNLERARTQKELINAIDEIERSVAITIGRAQAAAKQFPTLGSRLNIMPQQTNIDPGNTPVGDGAVREINGKRYTRINGQWFEQ